MKAVINAIFDAGECLRDPPCTGQIESGTNARRENPCGVPLSTKILGREIIDYAAGAAAEAGFEVSVIRSAADFSPDENETYIIIAADAPLITPGTLAELAEFHISQGRELSAISGGNAVFAAGGSYLKENRLLTCCCGADNAMTIKDASELIRVTDRALYAQAVDIIRRRINNGHMARGVTLLDPQRTFIDFDVIIGADTMIYPGCYLECGTKIGGNCVIGPDARISATEVADGAEISYSVVLEAKIGRATSVGPFAYIRPGSVIGEMCKIGDFVEIKNSCIGSHTKASHLTYIGDSDVGENVNFGCGTVTVNYDSIKKHRTIVNDNAFIGCNTNLVAPVEVGSGAYTAAGSTITEDVPDGALAIARARQTNKTGWRLKRN